MNKKILAALAAVTCLGCGAFGFAGCLDQEHSHSFETEIVAPTCTKGGYTQYTCTDCDYFYRDNFTDPTGVHTPVVDQGVDPTCTKDGLTEGSHCKDCNAVLTAQETIDATGHEFTYTADADGLTHSGKCKNCDEEITHVPHTYEGDSCKDCGHRDESYLEFELSADKTYYIVTGLKTEKAAIEIPSSFRGLPVKEIGKSAFLRGTFTSVVIPDSITKIGQSAFARTALTSVNIPESVTEIGASAFYYCTELTNVSIPLSIIEVGSRAFFACDKLVKNKYEDCYYLGNESEPYVYFIDIGTISNPIYIHRQTKHIDGEALYHAYGNEIVLDSGNRTFEFRNNCLINVNTKTLVYGNENSIIPSDGSVVTINEYAFKVLSGEFNVTIPNTVEVIKRFAFFHTNKMSILHIPASVKVIEQGAFWSTDDIQQITVDSANKNYYVKNNCLIEKDTKILIKGCMNSYIPLNEGITEIADYAFTSCDISRIELPDSVKSIGSGAFNNCDKLTEFYAGNELTTIKSIAFSSCSEFALYLPSTLQLIERGALGSCKQITVHYDGTAAMWESIEKTTDWNKRSDITVHCSDGKVIEYNNYA